MTNVNKRVKDRLFRFLFSRSKVEALALYNAVSGNEYRNPDELIFTTLEDVIYLSMKNDLSFIIDSRLNLYEHQSTYNPNMPLRGLIYFSEMYKGLYGDDRIYSEKLLKIPTPVYVVFYNGTKEQPDRKVLRLSDSFEVPMEFQDAVYEWSAIMLNINWGHNSKLMERCKNLSDYSYFVDLLRKYNKELSIEDAMDKAVRECIEKDVLKDILSKSLQEVENMVLTEYNEEKYREVIRQDGYSDGYDNGYDSGFAVATSGMVESMLRCNELLSKIILYSGYTESDIRNIAERIGVSVVEE